MFLTDADLLKVSYGPAVSILFNRATKDVLLQCVKGWFKQPELRPTLPTSTWSVYEHLVHNRGTKAQIIERIVVDWSEGLTAYQLAELDIKVIMESNDKGKKGSEWRLLELLDDVKMPDRTLYNLDTTTAGARIHEELSRYFKAHVMTMRYPNESADWIRIMLFENQKDTDMPSYAMTAYYLRYPDTRYLVVYRRVKHNIQRFIEEALLKTYRATQLKPRNVATKTIKGFYELIRHQNSLGTFSRFHLNQADPNPLDQSQNKMKRPHDDDRYVKTRDQRRRIIPINQELIAGRQQSATDIFGPEVVPGIQRLEINMNKPASFAVPEHVAETIGDDEMTLPVSISIYGENVMEGLKAMVRHGLMEPPIPSWMQALASQGINKVYVTKDGALREDEPSDEENEENEEP